MLKKLVLGGLFLVLMGVLVVGAVVRTENRLERTAVGSESGAGYGRGAELHPAVPHDETGGGRGREDADHRDDTEDGADPSSGAGVGGGASVGRGADGHVGAGAGVSTNRISRVHGFSTFCG